MKRKMVVISRRHYESLLEDSNKLDMLMQHGVYNWGGYGAAMKDLGDEEDYDEEYEEYDEEEED